MSEEAPAQYPVVQIPPAPSSFSNFRWFADRFDPDHCEFCGLAIEQPDQPCPALDEGVCRP